MDASQKGIIFNIQQFSVHDGKGIRTIVFFKGCPLRCTWCSNPESQKLQPERAFNPMRCIGPAVCARCVTTCPSETMTNTCGTLVNNMEKCKGCFTCIHACPSGAQTKYGEEKTVDAILRKVEEDEVFYARSGGGLTLSGGEVLMQPAFAAALLREARRRHIHTAMETCGFAQYSHVAAACSALNELIFDIKHMDPIKHKEGTGVDNSLIIENLHNIVKEFPKLPITVRTPVIPGFNDSWDAIEAIATALPQTPNVQYELLEYHRMGEPKYEYLGRKFAFQGVTPDSQRMMELQSKLKQRYGHMLK